MNAFIVSPENRKRFMLYVYQLAKRMRPFSGNVFKKQFFRQCFLIQLSDLGKSTKSEFSASSMKGFMRAMKLRFLSKQDGNDDEGNGEKKEEEEKDNNDSLMLVLTDFTNKLFLTEPKIYSELFSRILSINNHDNNVEEENNSE